MPQHSTVRERVEHGLNTIPVDLTVTVSLRDLLFIHQTLGEFVRIFHQPMHYPDLAAVERFLGSSGTPDAFEVFSEACYHRIREMIPTDVAEEFGESTRVEHPLSPDYFAEAHPQGSSDA